MTLLRHRILPILTVLLAILILWHLAVIYLNMPFARDQATRAGQTPGFFELLPQTFAQERPVLPAPHQIAAELWDTTVNPTITSKRRLIYHAGVTLSATLLGFGDCYEDLRRRSTELGLDDVVTFTGRVGPPEIARHLSAASVGLCPDLKTPLNDVSTMNKTMEYMAYALPTVSFDLVETRVSAGETCLFVESGDVGAFADAVERLLDDPELRVRLAREARDRVSTHLDWKPQSEAYVGVWESLLGSTDHAGPVRTNYVDLVTREELERFVLSRGPIPPAS